jgi:hypothetical protein
MEDRYKSFMAVVIIGLFSSCATSPEVDELNEKMETLQQQVADSYKPGFGEFMSIVQVHHEKLWFAGTNANWPLADFEVHEIEEIFEDLKQFHAERKESELLGMMDPALDSMDAAIGQQDTAMFRASYLLLTNTCNSCHIATEHGFVVIKTPDTPPFSGQVFLPEN